MQFSSPAAALSALAAGHHYHCTGLAAGAALHLSSRLGVNTVLLVLQETLLCPAGEQRATSSHPVCRPPTLARPSTTPADPTGSHAAVECCKGLQTACLTLIDREAGRVLSSAGVVDTPLPALRLVLSRSSLAVTSELECLAALLRWSTHACAAKQLQPSPTNLRQEAAGAQYLVRYLTLNPDQLRAAAQVSLVIDQPVQCSGHSNGLRYFLLTPFVWPGRRDS